MMDVNALDDNYPEYRGDDLNQQAQVDGSGGDENKACQSCRKKKSKCSRQQPCSQCVKSGVECTYEDRRLKGGIKTGVVERLNQRLDTLESMFLGQSILLQQCIQGSKGSTAPLQDRTESLRHALHALARSGELDSENATLQEVASPFEGLSQKRKAECDPGNPPRRAHRPSTPDVLDSGPLPETIHCALLAYFRIVHPWVPVLHPATFTKRATGTKRSSEVNMLLRAIIACSFRYLTEAEITDVADLPAMASTCREKAMAAAVSDTTIQSLQALLLLIFDSLCQATASSTWSLVSLLARKVEQLQLYSERPVPLNLIGDYFLSTSTPNSLPPAATWLEMEERRRVFWAAFLMDRFSSIVANTNPVLDSRTVHQRLPCDGCMWESDQCVETSYFRIEDQHQSDMQACVEDSPFFPSPQDVREGASGLGGFAYTIEATENLTLIAQFNHRCALEPESATKISAWLNRFRQLDSRLLQWELCLTHRWREVRVVNGYIDPNVTVAHMTHNAAIILLHQRLALPPPQSASWLSGLVSTASKEACVTAVNKIDKIARKYLAVSKGIAPCQFAFCLFVAGQFLLSGVSTHAVQRNSDDVISIIASLNELSRRLCPDSEDEKCRLDLPAARFAKTLAEQRDRRILSAQQTGNGAGASRSQCMTPSDGIPFVEEISGSLQQQFGPSLSHGMASVARFPFDTGAEGVSSFMPPHFPEDHW